MNSNQVRQKFIEFFHSKGHTIVPSAPMVIKDDPTLMFTNAGMNQFKEVFLGNAPVKFKRIADTQKCLRVSGKHNDLEEVGHDVYHHTMFEMLGNWSFGDYFKKEAIQWAWEFLIDVMKIDKDRVYVTIFEGDQSEKLDRDTESYEFWKSLIDEKRILTGNKKDNFWEMGESGPCGPCSEIHVDLRPEEDRKVKDGKDLVNTGNPKVIEIWNLVFIQYNRKVTGELESLPKKHVDTGMGFERLCMVLQNKTSNYDTDIFQPIIREITALTGHKYGQSEMTDIAMRVVSDHLRAVCFAIADGLMPSNAKAGYVIRRILRRAVRYNYSYLEQTRPVIYKLIPSLIISMGDAFPELISQKPLIEKVIFEEEQSFLRTLESGDKRLKENIAAMKKANRNELTGKSAFELYDTYGFPLDLTELILKEHHFTVNKYEFEEEMMQQRTRSKAAAAVESADWIIVRHDLEQNKFVGYDQLRAEVRITRLRSVATKNKKMYHLVFNETPFYAESGGQVGDTGYIDDGEKKISIINTIKEHGLIIHVAEKLPPDPSAVFEAVVDEQARADTEKNHTATHLLHYALRKVLGNHVEQKGSLVNANYLRFDFSHYQKMSDDELARVEDLVNRKISEDVGRNEMREATMKEARGMGAMALFGEKYGDTVRIIQFGDSVELCGGTHVEATSRIGIFKIISESSIAAGIRRIEAVTSKKAETWYRNLEKKMKTIEQLLDNPQDIVKTVGSLVEEKRMLQQQLEKIQKHSALKFKKELIRNAKKIADIQLIAAVADDSVNDAGIIRDIAYQLRGEMEDLFLVIGANINNKPYLAVMISDKFIQDKKLNAVDIVRTAALEFDGGGGGQPFFATAGGKDLTKLNEAIAKACEFAHIAAANR
jgi:alanyl-tRNA synthetase